MSEITQAPILKGVICKNLTASIISSKSIKIYFLYQVLVELSIILIGENDKYLEILILRHQLNIVARKQNTPQPTRTEKLVLAVLVNKLKQHFQKTTRQLQEIVRMDHLYG